jgi:CDP-diacylglycerol--glycerol-3-phosphate 3-phosphatidyltransferase
MNLPNKITLARIAMIPVFMIVLMCGAHYEMPYYALISAVIFAIASFTDGVDGHIARSRGLITDFGKFMDPLADKLLVSTALICFIQLDWIPAYMAVIIIAREFIVTGLRTLAASKGIVMAAIMTGKVKTVLQMIAILCTMVFSFVEFEICGYPWIGFVTMAISTLFTIYSGYEYIAKNVNLLKDM